LLPHGPKAIRRRELKKVADQHQKQHTAKLSFPEGQSNTPQEACGGSCGSRLEVFLLEATCLEELREVADQDLKQHVTLDLKSAQQNFKATRCEISSADNQHLKWQAKWSYLGWL